MEIITENIVDNAEEQVVSSSEDVLVRIETSKMKLGDTFDQFEQFQKVFDEMSKETFQMWTERNTRYQDKEKTVPNFKKFVCVHHGNPDKIQSKGNNIRTNQRFNAKACPKFMLISKSKAS